LKESLVAKAYVPSGSAMKTMYFLLAATLIVFVSMIVLTQLHP
jgi:hypothetical protein